MDEVASAPAGSEPVPDRDRCTLDTGVQWHPMISISGGDASSCADSNRRWSASRHSRAVAFPLREVVESSLVLSGQRTSGMLKVFVSHPHADREMRTALRSPIGSAASIPASDGEQRGPSEGVSSRAAHERRGLDPARRATARAGRPCTAPRRANTWLESSATAQTEPRPRLAKDRAIRRYYAHAVS